MSWLRHALGTVVVPAVAARSGVSIWFMTTGDAGWIHRSATCPVPADGFPRVSDPPGPSGRWERHDLPLDREPGTLWACIEAESRAPEELPHLIEAARTIAELRDEQAQLKDELELTYENLSSVYEISANPELLLDSERALDLILDRLTTLHAGLEAVVWIVDGGQLVARRWRGQARPEPRPLRGGFLGRVLQASRTLVDNRNASPGRAASTAAAPIRLESLPIGVLEIGSERPERFDGRVLALLGAFATQAAMVIENEGLRRRQAAAIRATNEIEIASRMQQVLLQAPEPTALPGLDVGVASVAARGADGDFFEFFRHPDGGLDVLVGDVMGKGLPAALVGAAVKSEFLRYGSMAGLTTSASVVPPSDEVVSRVHGAMSPRLEELACFVTATHHRIDRHRGRLVYVDCGHVPPLIASARGQVRVLRRDWDEAVNLPLGITESEGFFPVAEDLEPGDVLLLYSDGVTEATNESGEMYGIDRLAAALGARVDLDARDLARALQHEVTGFTGARGLGDDLTCVVVKLIDGVVHRITLAPELDQLATLRRFLDETARTVPWLEEDEQARYEVVLAGVEWASNVIRHGGLCPRTSSPLEVSLRVAADEIEIGIRDSGRPFRPEVVPAPDLENPAEGGLGLHLIRSVMHRFEVRALDDGRNLVRLVRRREVREGAGGGR